MIQKTPLWRNEVLKRTQHNVMLIPEELVERDFLTDSLLNKPIVSAHSKKIDFLPKTIVVELENSFKKLFGFKYIVPVSQGRVAEALLARLLVRNGLCVPGSALFPTTRIHQQLAGGVLVEIGCTKGYESESPYPFKGDLDTEALEKALISHHARWCAYVCVEPCNNALGGHPISMANMKEIHRIASKYEVPIYIDGTRIMENVIQIKEREVAYKNTSLEDILKEFCSYAEGMAMSVMKDFVTPIGGFFATRREAIYHDALDFVMGFGSGLSYGDKKAMNASMEDPKKAFSLVSEKMRLVQILYEGIKNTYPVVNPVGGHAVYLDAEKLNLNVPKDLFPIKSFLHYLYSEFGIRGGENPQSIKQEKMGMHLVRFAVPIVGQSESSVKEVVRDLIKAYKMKDQIEGLRKISEPPGFTGPFRAAYEVVKHVGSTVSVFFLLFSLAVSGFSPAYAELSAKDIVIKSEDRYQGDDVSSALEVHLINDRGEIRKRELLAYRKNENGLWKDAMKFTFPNDIRDTGTLNEEVPNGDDLQYLYLPAAKKLRRVSGKSQSWVGTDYNYEDIQTFEVEFWDYQLIGSEIIDGFDCYKVEETLKPGADSIYSKRIAWIRKDTFYTVKLELFDKTGQLIKEIKMNDIFDAGDNALYARNFSVKNVQDGHRTEFKRLWIQINSQMPDELLTTRHLERSIDLYDHPKGMWEIWKKSRKDI